VETLRLNLEKTVAQALAAAPHDASRRDSWLFTYGAMLETPPFNPVDRQVVACLGWRRAFCLSDPKLRGTPEHPGLSLGLLKGDQCVGVAWRLAAQTVRDDLRRVMDAEMRLSFYDAGWLPIQSPKGRTTALALVSDPLGIFLEPHLGEERIIERIATSCGPQGTNADYLRDVVAALDRAGVADLYLNRLWLGVCKMLAGTEG
jgi:cation transport protein ChaC